MVSRSKLRCRTADLPLGGKAYPLGKIKIFDICERHSQSRVGTAKLIGPLTAA